VVLKNACEYGDRILLIYIYPPNSISKHPPVDSQDFRVINSESHLAPQKLSETKVDEKE
jgi:hypothetical protein